MTYRSKAWKKYASKRAGCNDNSVQLLLHPFITRQKVCISYLSECIIINNSFATSTVNMNSGDMRVFISLTMMPYGCHLYTLVYRLSFLKKLYATHFMITSPCKFSFTDAVQFNFHLSLTLKTMQSYSGVFSSFRPTNPAITWQVFSRGLWWKLGSTPGG